MTSINGNFVGLEAVNGEVGWNKTKTREEIKVASLKFRKTSHRPALLANTQQRTAISRESIFSLLLLLRFKVLNWICNFRQAYEAVDMMSWSACALQANIDAIPKATGGGTREQQQHSRVYIVKFDDIRSPMKYLCRTRTYYREHSTLAVFFLCFGVRPLYAFCSTHSTTLFFWHFVYCWKSTEFILFYIF